MLPHDNHIKQMKNKDTYIKVRLTEDQKAKLDALAEDLNTDKSKIIRRQIDNLPDPRNQRI
jgi:predicted transcriptional regulator